MRFQSSRSSGIRHPSPRPHCCPVCRVRLPVDPHEVFRPDAFVDRFGGTPPACSVDELRLRCGARFPLVKRSNSLRSRSRMSSSSFEKGAFEHRTVRSAISLMSWGTSMVPKVLVGLIPSCSRDRFRLGRSRCGAARPRWLRRPHRRSGNPSFGVRSGLPRARDSCSRAAIRFASRSSGSTA